MGTSSGTQTLREGADQAAPASPGRRSIRDWMQAPVFALFIVMLVAIGARFPWLSSPDYKVSDEYYYVTGACFRLGLPDSVCYPISNDVAGKDKSGIRPRDIYQDTSGWVHPPLGKLGIFVSSKIFGYGSFAWRFPSAVAGVIAAMATAAMAWFLFRRMSWMLVAGLLVAVDPLAITTSRLALLDGQLVMWSTLGFLFLLLDHDWLDRLRRTAQEQLAKNKKLPEPHPIWRPWRFAAGVALGAAVATKWSGALSLLGALVIALMWERWRSNRRSGWLRAEATGIALALIVVPLAVYTVAWIPWLWSLGWSPADLIAHQFDMLQNFKVKVPDHSDFFAGTDNYIPGADDYSKPWTWFLVTKPFHAQSQYGDPKTAVSVVLLTGGPVLFWSALATLPYAAWRWLKKSDAAAAFIAVAFLALWAPWLFASRIAYFYYMAPMVPFLALALVLALKNAVAARPRASFAVPAGIVAVAMALTLWMWPILTASSITKSGYEARALLGKTASALWFDSPILCDPSDTLGEKLAKNGTASDRALRRFRADIEEAISVYRHDGLVVPRNPIDADKAAADLVAARAAGRDTAGPEKRLETALTNLLYDDCPYTEWRKDQ